MGLNKKPAAPKLLMKPLETCIACGYRFPSTFHGNVAKQINSNTQKFHDFIHLCTATSTKLSFPAGNDGSKLFHPCKHRNVQRSSNMFTFEWADCNEMGIDGGCFWLSNSQLTTSDTARLHLASNAELMGAISATACGRDQPRPHWGCQHQWRSDPVRIWANTGKSQTNVRYIFIACTQVDYQPLSSQFVARKCRVSIYQSKVQRDHGDQSAMTIGLIFSWSFRKPIAATEDRIVLIVWYWHVDEARHLKAPEDFIYFKTQVSA